MAENEYISSSGQSDAHEDRGLDRETTVSISFTE